MKKELITRPHKDFEGHAHQRDGVEFWFARELQELLGYSAACSASGHSVEDQFPDVRKMVEPSRWKRRVEMA